jgi:hypothetical protein
MRSIAFVAAGVFTLHAAPLSAGAPLQPGYKVNDWLQLLFVEYRVTGPHVEQPGRTSALVCTYSTRPVVMVYTREINPQVVRLIKKINAATGVHQKERLGSYVVLLCDRQNREKDLKTLAEKERIDRTLLSLVVLDAAGRKRFDDRFGAQAETTVILANAKRQVKASYAFRTGELTDMRADHILADLPKIFPKKE